SSLPDVALLKCDTRMRLTDVDPKLAQWLGFERDCLLQMRVLELIANADRREVQEALDTCALTGKPTQVRVRILAKDLEEHTMAVSFSALRNEEADQGLRLVFIQDHVAP